MMFIFSILRVPLSRLSIYICSVSFVAVVGWLQFQAKRSGI